MIQETNNTIENSDVKKLELVWVPGQALTLTKRLTSLPKQL